MPFGTWKCSFSMATWERNAGSSKYFAPSGHPRTQAWHLMQRPLTRVTSAGSMEPSGQRSAHRPQFVHASARVSGFAFRNCAGLSVQPFRYVIWRVCPSRHHRRVRKPGQLPNGVRRVPGKPDGGPEIILPGRPGARWSVKAWRQANAAPAARWKPLARSVSSSSARLLS